MSLVPAKRKRKPSHSHLSEQVHHRQGLAFLPLPRLKVLHSQRVPGNQIKDEPAPRSELRYINCKLLPKIINK